VRPISVATRAPVQHWSSSQPCAAGPSSSIEASLACDVALSLQRCPSGPRLARPAVPPRSNADRQRYTERTLTRSRRATSPTPIPSLNIAAACIRNASRRARPTASTPPPCAYLTPPA